MHIVHTVGGQEELVSPGDHRKTAEESGSSKMLTWGLLAAYMVAAVLVALLFSLATIKLLRKRKSKSRAVAVTLSRGRASPRPTQRAPSTLRNGHLCVHATETSNVVLIANHKEETTKL